MGVANHIVSIVIVGGIAAGCSLVFRQSKLYKDADGDGTVELLDVVQQVDTDRDGTVELDELWRATVSNYMLVIQVIMIGVSGYIMKRRDSWSRRKAQEAAEEAVRVKVGP